MERFEARYDAKMLATVSTSIRVFFGASAVLILGAFAYYALVLSQIDTLIFAAAFTVMLVADFFIFRFAEAKIRRLRVHARSGLPAITIDRRGVWVHERTGDSPIPWETIGEVEEIGAGKNSALALHTKPGTRTADKPITIPAGFYDVEFDEITAALKTLRERYS